MDPPTVSKGEAIAADVRRSKVLLAAARSAARAVDSEIQNGGQLGIVFKPPWDPVKNPMLGGFFVHVEPLRW